ncbi:MAG TPA: hypothetical protein VL793_01010 [Patescibacteria group bacterium]|nr:hypothetical protein [Patescibacteria group bacterium]
MARIKADETGNELGAEISWFRRLLNVFEVKPVFAGAFGTAVCAFLISGVVTSERTPAFAASTSGSVDPTFTPLPTATASANDAFASNSNGIPSGNSLFDQVSSLHGATLNVSYPAGGN